MMQLTEEQRMALAGLCRIEIKRWNAASESNPNMRYMVELMEIALASMEAKALGRVDRGEVSDSNEYPYARVVCLHEQADWENFQDDFLLYSAPPVAALSSVKRPSTKCIGWVRDAIHEHDAKWIEAIRDAGYQVKE